EAPAGAASTYRIVTERGQPNPVTELLDRHGLMGLDAHGKHVPDAVFRLPREQLATFLSRLFTTDGSAWWSDSGDGYGRISYCTVSARLAQEVQHLLLRFGLNARIRRRQVKYRSTRRPAFEIELMRRSEIESFADQIGIFGKERQVEHLVAQVRAKGAGATRDTLPVEVWDRILAVKGAESWADVSERTGRPRSHNWHVGRRSPRRDTVATLATALDDPALAALADSDVYWDEIVAIEFSGHDQVYDLTVPIDHNFVAGDVLVHNTSLALGMVANAALEAQRPVLLFSLEMSHLELTQRMLCSEARVDSRKIRTGNLAESDWGKISHAVGRLGDAPIWIDDNPNTTVMEIRAKARRLQAKVGDLGLIVVDYLQLMTGRNGAESRQVEISEISRGLKILARELGTPVVALSQLSRGLEQRTDKRPMLADLRESGAIEQDADVVLFIYRDEVYDPESPHRGTAELIISKHRNGPTGVARVAFLDHFTRFENMAKGV
ncbi:MAG: DnaB-like helicase C-terminal domain-containing protein, partial [Actinomycetota bacterium]